jgi:hypothetical protein
VNESAQHAWVKPVSVLTALVVSLLCAWWQIRRDRKQASQDGVPRRSDTWLSLLVFLVAVIGPLFGLKEMGSQPALGLAVGSVSLACQVFLWSDWNAKLAGRIEALVGLVFGTVFGLLLVVLATAKLLK